MAATLNIDAIRSRAAAFAKDFAGITYESGFDQKFVNRLCWVFNISDHRLVDFQTRVKKLGGSRGRIDAFLPGKLLVEMKSGNKDLDKAYVQATEYFPGLKDEEMPRYVLVSDFANLHLYDLQTKAPRLEIKLVDFPQNVEPFLFLADYEAIAVQEEQAANERAADKMAGLHDAIKATGYTKARTWRPTWCACCSACLPTTPGCSGKMGASLICSSITPRWTAPICMERYPLYSTL